MSRIAYVDTSCLVAIAFRERGGTALAKRLRAFDELIASNLLEAELRAAYQREDVPFTGDAVGGIQWILPDRPLSHEMATVLTAGYVRGADLWHLACALFVAPTPTDLSFATMDGHQRDVAKTLGFKTVGR